MKKIIMVPMAGVAALALAACGEAATDNTSADAGTDTAATETDNPITAADVEAAQQAWGEGIVRIGQTFTDEGDVEAAATTHINDFYGYEDGMDILFKPTLAAEDQFRGDFDGALSYFIGSEGTEDGGFAIAPYTDVRWENEGTFIDDTGDTAMAMGNYYFTGTDGNETKVEYTFGYERNDAGDLVIVLHHSSLPYSAQ
ncbi:phosphoribosyl-AMP cyclohydrolase [Aurantiacibacter sediminis]|uniref:Phosphoribosyl-AMP cyclohydrolase n=1 Tax=Aurantiacibacter sediminis TaxID=2793064 RepID=A0ABS0N322_9SPHN|nr:phosphoribosyl-AMP cyclohydrolase [Aurantiacibacter sediminis]MBH5322363.1 phosphoribosyl-AMP cyclohydrolase [Aurantiacibacter sediminis]